MTIPRNLSFLAQGASATGVLGTANGGTNLTSFTVNGIPYANSSSALNTSSAFTFNGSTLAVATASNSLASFTFSGGQQALIFANTGGIAYGIGSGGSLTGDYTYFDSSHFFKIQVNSIEALRVFSSGGVSIGNTTDPGAGSLSVTNKVFNHGSPAYSTAGWSNICGGPDTGIYNQIVESNSTSNSGLIAFSNPNGIVGSISTNGSLTSYNVTSDRRLKDNIVSITPAQSGKFIDALLPRIYTRISDNSIEAGFIADEMQITAPNCVTGEPNAVNSEGKPVYQMLDASTPEMVAYLVTEIQSLRARLRAANIA